MFFYFKLKYFECFFIKYEVYIPDFGLDKGKLKGYKF